MSNSGQNDPSTDEILTSIRRIISEDSGEGAASDDDILELTDEVAAPERVESGRPEPVIAAVEPTLQAEPARAEERQEPVLGMHAPESEPVESVEPAPLAVEAVEPEVPEPEPVLAPVTEPAPEPAQEAGVTIEDQIRAAQPGASASMFGAGQKQEDESMAISDEPVATPAAQPEAATGEIVSETATSATAAALGELSRAMDEKTSKMRVGEGDATVSDLVKEMIRPMLREWLDENLPGIVERIVRREIQKLVDRSQDDD